MALPVLAAGWLLVASGVAVRYDAYVRTETQVRAPFVGERTQSLVVADLLLMPNVLLKVYDARKELHFSYEPAVVVREYLTRPAPELRHSAYLFGAWQVDRLLRLTLTENATYGHFPLESIGQAGAATGLAPFAPSSYLYTGTSLSAESNLGFKRLNMGAEVFWFFNGSFGGPPAQQPPPGELRLLLQRGPVVQTGTYYRFTERILLQLETRARHTRFTNNRIANFAHASPGLVYTASPLLQVRLEGGPALLQNQPKNQPFAPLETMLTGQLSIRAPVPVGRPHKLLARVSARVVPYIDSLEGTTWPRAEADVRLEWSFHRSGTWRLGLLGAQSLAEFPRRDNQELRARVETVWSLSREWGVEAALQLSWSRHLLLPQGSVFQWYTSFTLVGRKERGRL
jgi:hypothetical protein